MKYKRLRIANYRGVDATEIEFETRGVTLVQGPNEVGKTSLGEAIRILFEHPDNASNRHVKAIRPVHQDAGPEIELEAESGPYCFTYYKRFHKKPATKLTITAPSPENHTGRDAHDRAQEILNETLDIDLWKALTIQQGDAIAQPDLANQQSLSAALDKAAGSVPTEQAEEDVFESVTEEYSRFYSVKTGKEGKTLKEATDDADRAESAVSEIEQKIEILEQDIATAARLQSELPSLTKRETQLREDLVEHAGVLREIESLEGRVSEATLKLESAAKTVELAVRDQKERTDTIAEVENDERKLKELAESSADVVASFENAEKQVADAEATSTAAEQRRKEADTLADLRRADVDHYKDNLFLEQLGERKERVDAARKAAAHAEAFLEDSKVDDEAVAEIDSAERNLLAAEAKLETAAPNVKLLGLGACELEIDDQPVRIEKDESRQVTIADQLRIRIPGQLQVEIAAGASTDDLTQQVENAKQKLGQLCRLAGVDDAQSARNAFDQRREALRNIEEKERIESENLRDLTYEQLAEKLLRLEETVPAYISSRVEQPEMAADLEVAKSVGDTAEEHRQNAHSDWESAHDAVIAARKVRDELGKSNESVRIELSSLEKSLEQHRTRLENDRASISDDQLNSKALEAETGHGKAKIDVGTAKAALTDKNPEKIKALAETAQSSLETAKARREAAQTELTEVRTRLRIHGEEGLHEKLHTAKTHLELVASTNRSLFRRASAAKLLYQIMNEERDLARRAYVAPLKERIERLGRLVFDESFQVEIGDDLKILSRSSGGVAVPFDSLSGGTKEQLSLVFRLACSMIVAEQGGMPLIMDDALGYTDPERLRLMGAVLAKAAKECQIVILTCVPERYGNVGTARVVSLQ